MLDDIFLAVVAAKTTADVVVVAGFGAAAGFGIEENKSSQKILATFLAVVEVGAGVEVVKGEPTDFVLEAAAVASDGFDKEAKGSSSPNKSVLAREMQRWQKLVQ